MGSLPWDDISAREADVLAAVREHQTNVQIASRLHISVRTVESHVSALLRKCGVSDRHELAALAAQAADLDVRPEEAMLPEARTTFVGRARELADTCDALSTNRLVTLTGPAGVGKTRLALSAAGAVAARFPAGVVYVDLVPVRVGHVVGAVASALGVIERPPRPLLDSVIARVRKRVLLLVLSPDSGPRRSLPTDVTDLRLPRPGARDRRPTRFGVCVHLRRYSGSNASKKIGKVPITPMRTSTAVMTRTAPETRLRRSSGCRTAQATSHTTTAKIVLPDNGPTDSLSLSQSFTVSLAAATVVTRPSAATPMPAASSAAAAGPSGRSLTCTGVEDSTAPAGLMSGVLSGVLMHSSQPVG